MPFRRKAETPWVLRITKNRLEQSTTNCEFQSLSSSVPRDLILWKGSISFTRQIKLIFDAPKAYCYKNEKKWYLKQQSQPAFKIACRDILDLARFLTVVLIAQNLTRY